MSHVCKVRNPVGLSKYTDSQKLLLLFYQKHIALLNHISYNFNNLRGLLSLRSFIMPVFAPVFKYLILS